MNKLLKEFLSYIFTEAASAQDPILSYMGKDGKSRSAKASTLAGYPTDHPGRQAYDKWKSSQGTVTAEPDTTSKAQSPEEKGKNSKKPSGPPPVTAGTVNPTASADDIAGNQLVVSNEKLVEARRKGIAGPGGAVASYGEASLTQLATQLNKGGLERGTYEFRKQHQKSIDTHRTKIERASSTTKGKKKIAAVGKELGLDPETDSNSIVEYIATREAYVEAELARLQADKDGIFYKRGKAGFAENSEAAREWAIAAFDGAVATSLSIQASTIDQSKPFTVIQSDVRGHDNELLSHLRQKLEASTSEEDKAHYQKQLDAWDVAKFHDTMVVGVDAKGRMTVFHVTNKKGNDLKDIWNNTTPAQAMGSLLNKFKKTDEGLTQTEKEGFAKVTVVMQNAVDACKDAANAAIKTWANKDFKVDTPLVNAVQELRKPPSKKEYVEPFAAWMDSPPTRGRSSAATKEFKAWADGAGKKMMLSVQKACSADSIGASCTKARLSAMQSYMQTNPKTPPPFDPVGKLLTKVGETQLKAGSSGKGSLGLCATAKQLEKDAVSAAHKMVVSEIKTSDEQTCKDIPKACKPNGPAARMYLEHVMHSMHFDMMADNWDENLVAVTGIRSSTPTDFRETLREASGFEGPIDTPEQRKALREHIINNAKIDAESGAIVISSPSGELVLVEDSWRTAGAGQQKVQKTVGDGVRTGVINRSDARRKENPDTVRNLFGRG